MTRVPQPMHPQVSVGHVHLKVADLDRALGFHAMDTRPLDLEALGGVPSLIAAA